MIKIANIYQKGSKGGHGGIQSVIGALQNLHPSLEFSEFTLDSASGKANYLTTIVGCDIPKLKYYSEIRKIGLDTSLIIHYPWPPGWILPLIVRRKYLIYYHSDILRQRWIQWLLRPLERIFFERASAIIFTSPEMPKLSSNSLVIESSKKKFYWPPTLSASLEERAEFVYQSRVTKRRSSSKAQLNGAIFSIHDVVLFIGVHRYYKGINTLLKAAKLLSASGINFVVAGDGPLYRENRRHGQMLELKNVFFLQSFTDYEKFSMLENAKCLVLPSTEVSEAFGVVLLEAISCGVPIITSDINSPMPNVVVDGVFGHIFRSRDEKALANAILRIYGATSDEYEAMCRSAREHFIARYSRQELSRRVYCDLLKI